MRVEVHSLGDFIAEVRESVAGGSTLMEDCVRFRIDRAPQQEESISFDVVYHVTAVVENMEESRDRYLLELSAYAGEDEPGIAAGSAAAEAARDELIEAMAEVHSAGKPIAVRRGKIEVI